MVSIDIVTITYNSAIHLQRCFESVRKCRAHVNNYIIIDGGSNDGTLDLIKNNLDIISTFVSEDDTGISDAFNKGVNLCDADFILLLNSDDWLIDKNFAKVCTEINLDDEIVFTPIISCINDLPQDTHFSNPNNMHKKNSVLHPGCFISSFIYRNLSGYNTHYQIAMDYEFFARCLTQNVNYRQLNTPVVFFQEGGISRQSKYKILVESFRVRRKYYGAIIPYQEFYKCVSRLLGDLLAFLKLKTKVKQILDKFIK